MNQKIQSTSIVKSVETIGSKVSSGVASILNIKFSSRSYVKLNTPAFVHENFQYIEFHAIHIFFIYSAVMCAVHSSFPRRQWTRRGVPRAYRLNFNRGAIADCAAPAPSRDRSHHEVRVPHRAATADGRPSRGPNRAAALYVARNVPDNDTRSPQYDSLDLRR